MTPSSPLVLVVDGHADTRELYVVSLSASGFEVVALDGAQAFTRVWETHPDIIVTDLMLHPRDGFELLRQLKHDPWTRQIPVVVVTGHAAPTVSDQAQREGCARFFVKPFPPDELATELRHVLAGETSDDRGSARVPIAASTPDIATLIDGTTSVKSSRGAGMRTVCDLVERVRAEYLEMPGLRLTGEQVERLCGIERSTCQIVLDTLVAERFLCKKPDGRYARLTDGQTTGYRDGFQ